MSNTFLFTEEAIKAKAWETLEKLYLEYDVEVAQHGYIALSEALKIFTDERNEIEGDI